MREKFPKKRNPDTNNKESFHTLLDYERSSVFLWSEPCILPLLVESEKTGQKGKRTSLVANVFSRKNVFDSGVRNGLGAGGASPQKIRRVEKEQRRAL